ncbi:MAG TPA: hypothetical protein VGN11_06710 [Candidatus Baltobacteraceae bacterium]|jgi:hypothetical protein|nr:hypothetical protein [Candidatus Baltobacteraceae bacterium]
MPQTTVPLVSSSTKGPLGAVHLPRLWLKLSLASHGQLPGDYDECGQGFDQMTLNGLGLDRQKTIDFVRHNHPTYMQFEQWVVDQNGGKIDPETVRKHNEAIHAYNHSDELGAQMRSASGNPHTHVKDAVTLNTVEDLDAIHAQMHPH